MCTPSTVPTQAPTPLAQPSSSPVLQRSWIRNVTVFYEYGIYKESGDPFEGDAKAEGTSDIWRIQGDGSGKRRLLLGDTLQGNWLAGYADFALSHDGRRLAFVQTIDLRWTSTWPTSLWTMNTDGSEVREWIGHLQSDTKPGSPAWTIEDDGALESKPRPVSLTWCPDDTCIAYVDAVEQLGIVHILNLRSGGTQVVGEGDDYTWSPDGLTLAMRASWGTARSHDLQIVSPSGQLAATIPLSEWDYMYSLDWSASRGLIVAQAEDGYAHPILIIDPCTGEKRVLLDDIGKSVGYPKWSPDGSMILVGRLEQDVRNLYILNPDTGRMRFLLPRASSLAVWSPDSRWVLVESEVKGEGLYIVSAADGQYWKIPNTDGEVEGAGFNSYDWLFPEQR